MKIKKILIISLILLTLSLTAVSANDLNDTDIQESSCGDDSLNSSLESVQLEETYASTQPGTFKDLQVEINNAPVGSVLYLSQDYDGAYGSRIQLNKDLENELTENLPYLESREIKKMVIEFSREQDKMQ